VVVDVFRVVFLDFVVFLLVVFRREIELDGRKAGHLEIRAAFGAAQLVALVDVELVDLDFGVAFRAGGHSLLGTCTRRVGLAIQRVACQNPAGGHRYDKPSDYSDILRGSAMRANDPHDALRYFFRWPVVRSPRKPSSSRMTQ